MKKPTLYIGNIGGPEGNAFVILGRAQAVAKDHAMDWPMIEAEAKSKDYGHLLRTMDKYFKVVHS